MIKVSDKWISAMRSPVRRERIQLTIITTEPRIYKKSDEDIVQGSLYVSQKVMSGSSFDIGTCNASELGVSFFEEKAKEINFGGAIVILNYSLYVGTDENGDEIWEKTSHNMLYFIDGRKTTRKGNKVTVKAYDATSLLDIGLPKNEIPDGSLYEKAKWIWVYALTASLPSGVKIPRGFMDEEEFNKLPNAYVSADFSSEQIVSCRDAIMWIAQLTCSYAVVAHNFEVEEGNCLVFKRHLYAGNMKNDREITPVERDSIEFTDTRTYCTYLLAYNGEDQKMYSKTVEYDESWDPQYINTGSISLPKNPLMSKMSAGEQDTVNDAIRQATTHPTRYIKMTGNVDFALEVLDVAAFTGGTIDIRKKVVAPITEIKWKYRGKGTIICNNIDEYTEKAGETSSAESAPAKARAALTGSAGSPNFTPVIPQSEKALAKVAGAIPNRIADNEYIEVVAGDCMRDGRFAVNEAAGINFYSKLSSPPIPYRPSEIKEKLPYASIGISDLIGDGNPKFEIISFTEYGLDANGNLNKYYNRLRFEKGHLWYDVYSPNDDMSIDLLGSVQKDYVDAQFEKSKEYSADAISAHDSDESAHEDIRDEISGVQNSITNVQNSVTSAWNSIHAVEDRVSDLESGGTGGIGKDYVDAQDESYFEQSKEYSAGAISAHDSDESAHEDIRDEISGVRNSVTSVQKSVTSAWNSIHEVEDKVSDLESGGGGGTYTTKIAFKNGGFDLTFANKDGVETVNEFEVTEVGGRITKITNTTAGREIEVTYE